VLVIRRQSNFGAPDTIRTCGLRLRRATVSGQDGHHPTSLPWAACLIAYPTLISEWRGRKDLGGRTCGSAWWNAINVALSPKVHLLGKTRPSVRNPGRSAAEARGPAVRHLRRQVRALVARRALPTSKARRSLHSVKSAFVTLRRSRCYGVSKVAQAASNDLAILLATAMRCRKEANSPAPLILIVLRCCRHGCRRNGSAGSLDRRRDRGGSG
jgi:hypothetical protein